MDANLKVSVVIATRNSAGTLRACLESIENQSYAPLELIVVDNKSADDTPVIAARYADQLIEAGPERSAQRNRGAAAASGDFLLFIDHDMVLEPDTVAACVSASGAGCDAVIIPEYSFGQGFLARARALERSCYIGDDDIEAARFFRREVFVASGGYDEELIAGGEDWDLHARLLGSNRRIGRAEARIGHDEGRVNTRETINKRLYYGPSFAMYRTKQPERARRQFRIWRPALVRNWARLARHPLLTIGVVYLKAVEFTAGSVGARRGKK
jgi:glycosyltransferase involved in cell wall biosynthesis